THSLFLFIVRLPPTTTLFPYTTLFRSKNVEKYKRENQISDVGMEAQAYMQQSAQYGQQLADIENRISVVSSMQDYMNSSDNGLRSEEHTSELQSRENLVCRLLLEKKNL